jgi:alpha-glucosidase
MADTMRLRYAWIPYIYTEARRTYDTGVAFIRPLYYDSPEQAEAYSSQNEYRFGDEVIVSPVVHPVDATTNLAHESIWLPEGEWIEQPTGLRLTGLTRITRSFFLEQVPLYARPGAIIPMQPPMLHTGTSKVDPLILRILPLNDHQQSSYTLYEDSGEDRGYMTTEGARTPLHANRTANVTTITIDPVQGSYAGMPTSRKLQMELPGDWPPTQVEVNGQPLPYTSTADRKGWWFEGNTLTTAILTDDIAANVPTTIVVTRNSASTSNTDLLNGFAGKMTSLRHAYDAVNGLWPIDDLVAAMQTGNRIGYHPENALAEAQRLPQLLRSSQTALAAIAAAEKTAAQVTAQSADPAALERARIRAERLSRAVAAVQQAMH